jgi:hypothetical protein
MANAPFAVSSFQSVYMLRLSAACTTTCNLFRPLLEKVEAVLYDDHVIVRQLVVVDNFVLNALFEARMGE